MALRRIDGLSGFADIPLPTGGVPQGFFDDIGGAFNNAGRAIGGAANDAGRVIGGAANDAGRAIGNAANDVGRAIGDNVPFIGAAALGLGALGKGIAGVASALGAGVAEAAPEIIPLAELALEAGIFLRRLQEESPSTGIVCTTP